MSRAVFPIWLFGLVAALIAVTAFGIAQLAPHKGTPFVTVASGLWVAYTAARARKAAR